MAIPQLVAAIDFGTSYSGYAFSTTAEFKINPLTMNPNQWVAFMIPTCLLLDKKQNLVSFGNEATETYNELFDDDLSDEDPFYETAADDYYYFHGFKTMLHQSYDLSESTMVKDFKGKQVKALDVFSKSIGALKSLLITTPEFLATGIDLANVRWVITVPGIWSDTAKQFMRWAAEKAGIPGNQLKIALEAEAASMYCQHLPLDKLTGAESGFSITKKGTKYMVIDVGGGIADITVHETLEGGKLKELYKASGGAFGGTAVDNKFIRSVFTEVVGETFMSELADKYPVSYLELYRQFETVKRTVTPKMEGMINMTISDDIINLVLKHHGEKFSDVLASSPISVNVSLVGNRLSIDVEMMKGVIFGEVINKITNHLKDMLKRRETNGISILLLVGGFSKSPMVQAAIRQAFPDKQVVVPEEAASSVLKGAVIFGHQLEKVVSRITRYSYGFEIVSSLDSGKHELRELMAAGTSIPISNHTAINYQTIRPSQETVDIKIYFSTEKLPAYTDDNSCMLLGSIQIKLPDRFAKYSKFSVIYHFGGTELKVTAMDTRKQQLVVNLNLLG